MEHVRGSTLRQWLELRSRGAVWTGMRGRPRTSIRHAWVVLPCLLGCATAAPVEPQTSHTRPRDPTLQYAPPGSWRELLAHADIPGITNSGPAEERSPQRLALAEHSIGWSVTTRFGEVFIDDTLGTRWGAVFYASLPTTERVPRDRYAALPDPVLSNLEKCHHCDIVNPLHGVEATDSARFFVDLARDHDKSRFLPQVPDHAPKFIIPLVWIRLAEMHGHLQLAQRLSKRHAGVQEWVLREGLARWLLHRGGWALAHGMPRTTVRILWERADALRPAEPALQRRITWALATLGNDIPPLRADPSVDDLVVRLQDDPYFPDRQWKFPPAHAYGWRYAPDELPAWADAEQPISAAWELVARGWSALPSLRKAMRNGIALRRCQMKVTREGDAPCLPKRTVADLALDVAGTIARRPFRDASDFDRWWMEAGHKGKLMAHFHALEHTEQEYLDRIVLDLLGDPKIDAWPALAKAVMRRSEVAMAIERALWSDEPTQGRLGMHRRSLAGLERVMPPLLEHPDPEVRVAAATLLARAGYWRPRVGSNAREP